MPDTLLQTRREVDATRIDDLIRLERRPLPAHDLDGVNARQWALAVCGAEVQHRGRDFRRVERAMGISFDRWDNPTCEQQGQFDHEARAGEVLSAQNHLISGDTYIRELIRRLRGQREAGWNGPDCDATAADLRSELQRRRTIWRQFLTSLDRYKAARREFDRVPVMARAA